MGNPAGGRGFLFSLTDGDFLRDDAELKSRGVHFIEEPRHEPFGTIFVFLDFYGNK